MDKPVQFNKYKTNWHNSNRLLTVKGFSGVKTGITPTAGSCLSVFYEHGDCSLITVVLGSRNIEYRWKDAYRVTLWSECAIRDKLGEEEKKPDKKPDILVFKR